MDFVVDAQYESQVNVAIQERSDYFGVHLSRPFA